MRGRRGISQRSAEILSNAVEIRNVFDEGPPIRGPPRRADLRLRNPHVVLGSFKGIGMNMYRALKGSMYVSNRYQAERNQ
jgi:hypothetical protein